MVSKNLKFVAAITGGLLFSPPAFANEANERNDMIGRFIEANQIFATVERDKSRLEFHTKIMEKFSALIKRGDARLTTPLRDLVELEKRDFTNEVNDAIKASHEACTAIKRAEEPHMAQGATITATTATGGTMQTIYNGGLKQDMCVTHPRQLIIWLNKYGASRPA